jgi:hypothetical protein
VRGRRLGAVLSGELEGIGGVVPYGLEEDDDEWIGGD